MSRSLKRYVATTTYLVAKRRTMLPPPGWRRLCHALRAHIFPLGGAEDQPYSQVLGGRKAKFPT